MGAARQGYNLLTRMGWLNFRENRWSVSRSYVVRDTLGPLLCKIAGHVPYQTDVVNDPSEWACHACSQFLPGYKP